MEKALLAKKIYESALHIITSPSRSWIPPVLTCSALEGTGIDEIWRTIVRHNTRFRESGELVKKRKEQEIKWMWSLLDAQVKDYVFSMPGVEEAIHDAKEALHAGTMTPDAAAERILGIITGSAGPP
jgi:LAO/AO transport system kinase